MAKILCCLENLQELLCPIKLQPQSLICLQELLLYLPYGQGVVTEASLIIIWKFVRANKTRYRILKNLESKNIIAIEKDEDDRRNRYITILIPYKECMHEVVHRQAIW